MQGRAWDQRDLWDVESVAGHLLPAGSVFAFLAGHRQELFPAEMFADPFPSGRGRPSVPADVMASVSKVELNEHEVLTRQHRQRATDADFQSTYRTHRPMVERSIAWLVRGNRRVPYRGVAKNNAWAHHRVAALNLRRLLALGLTQRDGAWQLA
jgi:Transposase DDE domain